jgi:putative transposase
VKRKRFSVEQIVAVLKQTELGMPVTDVTRKMGISEQAFFVAGRSSTRDGGPAEAAPRRERAAEEALNATQPGQGDPAGLTQENGTARAEASGSELCGGPRSAAPETGLPHRLVASQQVCRESGREQCSAGSISAGN